MPGRRGARRAARRGCWTRRPSFAFQLDEAEQSGLRVVASVDESYPPVLVERLGRGAPPMLYVVGDPRCSPAPLLGIVGSRNVDRSRRRGGPRPPRPARSTHGLGVVSGAAKGVDRLGDERRPRGRRRRRAGCWPTRSCGRPATPTCAGRSADGRLCLCTPYKPTAGFSVANAMGRNKLIYALSRATLVVAADVETGRDVGGRGRGAAHGDGAGPGVDGRGRGTGNACSLDGRTGLDQPLRPLSARDLRWISRRRSSQLALEV